MENASLIVENVYNAPVEKVWLAITDKNQMKEWYFDLEEFKPEVGFQFEFEGGPDDRKYMHLCEITEVDPEKKLSYTWNYEGYVGDSEVSFELFGEGDKTRLKLTHKGLDTFPDDNPDFDRKNFEAGWNEIIGTSLKNYVEEIKV